MKKRWKLVVVITLLCSAFFYVGKRAERFTIDTSDLNKSSRTAHGLKAKNVGERKVANTETPGEAISELNKIIFSVKDHTDIKKKSLALSEKAEVFLGSMSHSHPEYEAVVLYKTVSDMIPELEGLLWRLGGIAIQSEFIYYALIGGLTDVAYNNFMYSKPVDHFLEYLVRPVQSSERFNTMSELQDYTMTKLIPLINKKILILEEILKKNPNWNDFSFQYDRAIVAGGIDFSSPETIERSFSSEGDRYATFTRSYLASAMGYTKNILAGMYLFCAYNLDDLNKFLNKAFFEAVTKTKLKGLFTDWITSKDSNIKLNTHSDYKKYLSKYPYLFTLLETGKWSNGVEVNGQEYREKAHNLYIEANTHDLEYIKQIHVQSEMPNQGRYIIDASEMITDHKYSVEHYQKLDRILRGPQNLMDSATGKLVTVDLSKIFSKDFNKDLKAYFPISFDFENRKNFHAMSNGKHTFIYTYGRPNKWPDPKFGGLLPEATNKNLRELYRRLMYNNDIDYIMGLVLGYVL